jgi:hypothetical protein
MVGISKVVRVLSCGFALWVGLLSNMAQADTMVPKAEAEKDSQETGGQGDPKELSIHGSKECTSSKVMCCA